MTTTALPIPQAANELVARLVAATPSPKSIWLLGSRANGRARPDSDTDFLVFASREFMVASAGAIANTPSVDVLVVYDGENFEDIHAKKRGSLDGWKWQVVSERDATYLGGKFVPDTEMDEEMYAVKLSNPNITLGECVEYEVRAIRVWPR
jgi:predicted nucleotidyltransferase